MNSVLYSQIIINKVHHRFRRRVHETLAELYSSKGYSPTERMTSRFEYLCNEESPVFLEGEKICFLRTIENIPPIFTNEEWKEIEATHYIHERGYHSNICVDYGRILNSGLSALRDSADKYGKRSIDALLGLVDRYRVAAAESGLDDIANILERVPRYSARNFREAVQFFRIINYALWLEGNYHNNIGRFDRYMLSFFNDDLKKGILTEKSALEMIEELFLSLNRDSDLYVGVQQGDNGQSLMLGGMTEHGDGFNRLSELCLKASCNLRLIDPKINLRVSAETPDYVYTLGSRLTKYGLGFPQYSNDDIVIPGLINYGYDPKDAMNYTVAACWEFIIPGVGEDVNNIAAFSFPKVIDTCLHRDLPNCASSADFKNAVKKEIEASCEEICNRIKEVWFIPSPFLNVLMNYDNGIPKYRNFGMHGVGLSTAADSLTAIDCRVFSGEVETERLIKAVDNDFLDEPELLHCLRYETPKLGSDNAEADNNLVFLINSFAEALENKRNAYGGRWRPGTGSAMYYLWSAAEIDASPDGRRKGEPFSANYSVSLFSKPEGVYSLISSMTKPDLKRVINGGPLTLEFHSSLFQTDDSVEKVGQFVKSFIKLGGHQLQLNAINADTLRDAQKNPEKYPLLIVRVWGWSAYFNDLDLKFQNHVISRQEYLI